jgi:hypothetical protein
LNFYGDWHLNFHSITTTTGKTVHLSITHVGINNEMGEAGLAARSASEIGMTSILALSNADASGVVSLLLQIYPLNAECQVETHQIPFLQSLVLLGTHNLPISVRTLKPQGQ